MTTPPMSPERAREILERRARELARRPVQLEQEATMQLVEFRIAGERYAIEARQVVAVFALAELVPLPGATLPVAGITIWRGNLLTLLDVRVALGLSATALNDLRTVIVLGDSRSSAGILVDSLQGIATRRMTEFRSVHEKRSSYALGLSADAVMLIDGAALARQHGSGGQPE